MEWAIGVFFALMLGLYIWSHATVGRAIGKKVQPFIDDVLGVGRTADKIKGIRTTSRQAMDKSVKEPSTLWKLI